MDRGTHAALAGSFRNGSLNSANTTSTHALSQERRRGARAAMQNLTDTLAKQCLVCAEKALAEGTKHNLTWAQEGEGAEGSLSLRYHTLLLTEGKQFAAIHGTREAICCCHLQGMELNYPVVPQKQTEDQWTG